MKIESEILQVHLEDIIPNRFQPRLSFDEQGLKELSDSIKEHGIIQPLVLRKLGDKFEIIAGERRFKAATMAGLTTVPAVISNIDDNTSAEIALVENVQRKDLTPIEEARSYKNLLDKGYLNQDQLAKRMGLSQSSVANKLRLLNLDDKVQQSLLEGKISERHARALLTLSNKDEQIEWLDRVINERMTVRQLDMELKKVNGGYVAEEIEEAPTTNGQIDINNIRNTAMDLNAPEIRPSAESMMMPESLMTEHSESLPTVPQPFDQPFVTVNPLNTGEVKEEKPLNNKFFDFNADFSEQATQAETVELTPPPVEVFDAPFKIGNETINDATGFIEPVSTPEAAGSGFFNRMDTGPKVSSENRFFTPATADIPPELERPIIAPVDPVTEIAKLDESLKPNIIEVQQANLGSAIKEVRSVVTSLLEKGAKITIDEADLATSYQITININK